jgi:type I phosphodiesterase/nucleotide pyrophosphatase
MQMSVADARVRDRPRQHDADRVLVCYLSGLDRRWLTPDITPAICSLLAEYPSAPMVGFPNTELASTIMSGASPHRHGLWQVALDPHPRSHLFSRIADRLPDLLTTTAQCAIHVMRPSFDLAGVPYRRRRRLRQTRFKYYMRADKAITPESDFPRQIGESATLFASLAATAARYRLSTDLRSLPALLLPPLFGGRERLEFLEIRGVDIFEHWHLDNPAAMAMGYGLADRFVADLTRRCDQSGALLLLVSDHGQEVVRRQIDLARQVRLLGLADDEYDMFLEVPSARFWFHTDRARDRIGELLDGLGGSVLGWRDLLQFGIDFPDRSNGELYWVADPGTVIFPHDFHHPIGNLAMAASDWQQRPRLSNPVHRGYHAYMPHHPCEQGFVVVRDRDRKLRDVPLRLVDVAPTVLHLLGLSLAGHMAGRSAVLA